MFGRLYVGRQNVWWAKCKIGKMSVGKMYGRHNGGQNAYLIWIFSFCLSHPVMNKISIPKILCFINCFISIFIGTKLIKLKNSIVTPKSLYQSNIIKIQKLNKCGPETNFKAVKINKSSKRIKRVNIFVFKFIYYIIIAQKISLKCVLLYFFDDI